MIKTINKICTMAVLVLVMALMFKSSVSAKEITVKGQEIQTALNEAANSGEPTTVIIPAGKYTLNSSLLVYSNTTIRADGAEITINGAQPALTVSRYIEPTNIKVFGGTWRAMDAEKVIDFNRPSSDITLENMTVYGNKTSMGIHLESVKGGKVSKCTVEKVRIGIDLSWCERIEVSDNVITDSSETGFQAVKVAELTVKGNKILRNGKYGMLVDWDTASSIDGNFLDGCALDPSYAGHGEGLVVRHSEGTWVQKNKVYNVESHEKNWGNGILIGTCKNITVQGNVVDHAGNHGMQATYGCENIHFNDNEVSNSGNIGISISRATTADITGGSITNTTGSAIVYDGTVYEGKTGVSGTVDGCMIDGSTDAGIYIELANVTVKNTTVKNSTGIGVTVLNSTATLSNNVIRQDAVDTAANGIETNKGAKVILDGNRICNFGNSGIMNNPGCTITGTNNQIMVNANKFVYNSIYCPDGANFEKIKNNTLLLRAISDTEVTGQNYWLDFECGAVVNGVQYTTKSGNGGYFTVSYPQTDSSKVIVYVKDDAGNAIILQASPDFDLNKLQSADQEGRTKRIEELVKRMYRTMLGREAEDKGVQYYVSELQSGVIDGATMAQNFAASPEFQNKKLSEEDYLIALYSAFFGRTPGPAEVKYWKDEMASGMSRKYVLKGFVNSDEYEKLCQDAGISRGLMVLAEGEEYEIKYEKLGGFVERLYVKALNRKTGPSEEEKQYYVTRIADRTMTAEQAAKNFFFSPEFKSQGNSNEEYIGRLYLTFMDREAEPDGMSYWLNQMKGGMSRETVLEQFAASDEFKNIMKSYGIR